MSEIIKCEYCHEGWKPLFRIIERYEHGEPIDNFCECEDCEHDWYEDDPACKDCEAAPVYNQNQLNLSIYVLGSMGELVFEDKVQQCQKYRKLINFCPMCGRRL